MWRILIVAALFTLPGCDSGPRKESKTGGSPGPGAASIDELRERGLAAIRAGDPEAYLELVASPAFLMKHCADEPEYSALEEGGAVSARDQQRDKVRRALEHCLDVKWDGSAVESEEGGGPKKSTNLSCDPASVEYDDLIAVVRAGEAVWRVKVANDVYLVDGRYVALNAPACER
jgi:hypothetical protein